MIAAGRVDLLDLIVDATGARRRLQALQALGHSGVVLARHLGAEAGQRPALLMAVQWGHKCVDVVSTAKRYSGSQSTVYGNYGGGYSGDTTDQMVWNTYSPADQAWIAAGKVGEKAGKIFERNFERPPTVYLESGTPVGILILNVKDR